MRAKKITALFIAIAILLGINSTEKFTVLTDPITVSASGPVILPDGQYFFKNKKSDKFMAVRTNPDGTSNIDAGVTQWDFNGHPGQTWNLKRQNNGSYLITPQSNTNSRLHLTGAVNANGTTVQTYYAGYDVYQQWWIYQNSNGTYRFVPIVSYTRTVNVRGSVLDNGAGIEIWDEIGSASQQWEIIPVGDKIPTHHTWNVSRALISGQTLTDSKQVYMNAGDTVSFNLSFNAAPGWMDFGIVNASGTFWYFRASGSSASATYTMSVTQDGVYQMRIKNSSTVSVGVTGAWTYSKRFYNWHANDSSMNPNSVFFHTNVPRVVVTEMETISNFTLSYVEGLAASAVNEWNSTHDAIPCTFAPGINSSGNIYIRSGRPQYLYNKWGFDMTLGGNSVVNGVVDFKSTSFYVQQIRTIKGSSRQILSPSTPLYLYFANKYSSGTLTVLNKTTSYNPRSPVGHKNTLKHELGHALGISGHATASDDLMNGSTSNTTELFVSAKNRDHIMQFRRSYFNGTL